MFSVVNEKNMKIQKKEHRIADEWARYPVDPPLSAGQSQSRHSDAEEHIEEVFVLVFVFHLNLLKIKQQHDGEEDLENNNK